MRVMRRALEGEPAAELPILSIDFDSTIHSYEYGWQDGTIYGTVIEGFFEWLMSVQGKFQVVIFSTRSAEPDKLEDMARWLQEQYVMWRHGKEDEGYPEEIPVQFSEDKPKAHVAIDDRAITFRGRWDAEELQADALAAFKPWNAV
jgi:hypothetical protein